MNISGMLHGAGLLKIVDFPASEVLGPAIIYLFVIFNRLGFYAVVLRQRHDPAHH